jgi:hypothetical protein
MRMVTVFPTGNVIWLNFFDDTDDSPSAVKARRRSCDTETAPPQTAL